MHRVISTNKALLKILFLVKNTVLTDLTLMLTFK